MVRRSLAFALLAGFVLSASATAGKRVLVVGDSHSTGQFKDGLLKMLTPPEATGLSVAVRGSCGSSPQHWTGEGKPWSTSCGYYEKDYDRPGPREPVAKHETPSLPRLMDEGKPEYVVVAMGTNQLGDAISTSETRVRKLIGIVQSKGARCFWVGPPRVGSRAVGAQNLDAFYTMLRKVTDETGCKLIDSRPKTDPAFVEKRYYVHYPNQKGVDWGAAVGSELLQKIKYWTSGKETATGGTLSSPSNAATSQSPAI